MTKKVARMVDLTRVLRRLESGIYTVSDRCVKRARPRKGVDDRAGVCGLKLNVSRIERKLAATNRCRIQLPPATAVALTASIESMIAYVMDGIIQDRQAKGSSACVLSSDVKQGTADFFGKTTIPTAAHPSDYDFKAILRHKASDFDRLKNISVKEATAQMVRRRRAVASLAKYIEKHPSDSVGVVYVTPGSYTDKLITDKRLSAATSEEEKE